MADVLEPEQVNRHLARLLEQGLGLVQCHHRPAILEGGPRLVDTDDAVGAAVHPQRVANPLAQVVGGSAAQQDGLPPARRSMRSQHLPRDDLEVADGKPLRVVAEEDEEGNVRHGQEGEGHPRYLFHLGEAGDCLSDRLIHSAQADGGGASPGLSLGHDQVGLAAAEGGRELGQHALGQRTQGDDGRDADGDAYESQQTSRPAPEQVFEAHSSS